MNALIIGIGAQRQRLHQLVEHLRAAALREKFADLKLGVRAAGIFKHALHPVLQFGDGQLVSLGLGRCSAARQARAAKLATGHIA